LKPTQRSTTRLVLLGMTSGALVFGCESTERKEPVVSASFPAEVPRSLCDGALLQTDELLKALPQRVGPLCSDPHSSPRVAGASDAANLEDTCRDWLAESCNELVEHGVMRIAEQHYVDGTGGPESLRATVFRFRRPEGAYAYFTSRLLGVTHPSRLAARSLDGVPSGVVQGERASILHGPTVVELVFASPRLTQEQLREGAVPLFETIGREVSAALPDTNLVPDSVALLPLLERIPFGLRYVESDALGIEGAGPGAFGYYARADRRYQVYVYEGGDEGAASDVERTFRRSFGFRKLEKMALGAFELEVGPEFGGGRWLVGRVGGRLAGAGEDLIDVAGEPQEVRDARRLSRLEKFRLVRDVLSARASR
jgi:hypothetical protein